MLYEIGNGFKVWAYPEQSPVKKSEDAVCGDVGAEPRIEAGRLLLHSDDEVRLARSASAGDQNDQNDNTGRTAQVRNECVPEK